MQQKIKESVGTVFAHIIKVDKRDLEQSIPLFCDIMGQNFECTHNEVRDFLYDVIDRDYDIDKHIEIIKIALSEDKISKFHLLEQLNHIIYSGKITNNDYQYFENIKNKLFDS